MKLYLFTQLSLMIKDNSLEDSTQTALKQYARADLLTFQEKETEAIGFCRVGYVGFPGNLFGQHISVE